MSPGYLAGTRPPHHLPLPPTLEPSLTRLLEWATTGVVPDTTEARVRFDLGARSARWQSVDVNRLIALLRERFECWRRGEQYVWVSDRERLIVIQVWSQDLQFDGTPMRNPRIHSAIEVWASADGYHARLDELAGVAG